MTGAEQLLHAMNALRRDVLSIPRTALERVETVHVSLLAEQWALRTEEVEAICRERGIQMLGGDAGRNRQKRIFAVDADLLVREIRVFGIEKVKAFRARGVR